MQTRNYIDDFLKEIAFPFNFHRSDFSTTCSLDMTYFPYDTQTCNIDVGLQMYPIERCNLTLGKTNALISK